MRSSPSALVIDFAGVMTSPLGASWEAWSRREGLPPGHWRTILRDHPEGRRAYAELEVGAISQAEWGDRTGRLLGVDGTNLMGRAHADVRAAEPMMRAVRAARAAGLAVALLSNSYGTSPYNPYEALGVWELCDIHVISEREGVAKPDPEIYRRVLTRLGCPADACVFVDDRAENLVPARALGMATVHATSPQAAAEELAVMLGISCEAGS